MERESRGMLGAGRGQESNQSTEGHQMTPETKSKSQRDSPLQKDRWNLPRHAEICQYKLQQESRQVRGSSATAQSTLPRALPTSTAAARLSWVEASSCRRHITTSHAPWAKHRETALAIVPNPNMCPCRRRAAAGKIPAGLTYQQRGSGPTLPTAPPWPGLVCGDCLATLDIKTRCFSVRAVKSWKPNGSHEGVQLRG